MPMTSPRPSPMEHALTALADGTTLLAQTVAALVAVVTLLAQAVPTSAAAVRAPSPTELCGTWHVTGYLSGPDAPNPTTADGTPIGTPEPIAAAHASIPFGAVATIDGLGSYRIADRGRLGPRDLDVRVWTRAEAYATTGDYQACVRWG